MGDYWSAFGISLLRILQGNAEVVERGILVVFQSSHSRLEKAVSTDFAVRIRNSLFVVNVMFPLTFLLQQDSISGQNLVPYPFLDTFLRSVLDTPFAKRRSFGQVLSFTIP